MGTVTEFEARIPGQASPIRFQTRELFAQWWHAQATPPTAAVLLRRTITETLEAAYGLPGTPAAPLPVNVPNGQELTESVPKWVFPS